jgi:hypothetical protein
VVQIVQIVQPVKSSRRADRMTGKHEARVSVTHSLDVLLSN